MSEPTNQHDRSQSRQHMVVISLSYFDQINQCQKDIRPHKPILTAADIQ